ncbi:hypothetical protein GvMRE_IIg88 [endosymbiont GvMRE of Glomus versiforme]|nr:hypothetical protein GvMRE_IIg88 [endosymbiont GvMRE of Glomus versiforme]
MYILDIFSLSINKDIINQFHLNTYERDVFHTIV